MKYSWSAADTASRVINRSSLHIKLDFHLACLFPCLYILWSFYKFIKILMSYVWYLFQCITYFASFRCVTLPHMICVRKRVLSMVVEEPNVPGTMHTEPAVTSSGRGCKPRILSPRWPDWVVIAALHENPRK